MTDNAPDPLTRLTAAEVAYRMNNGATAIMLRAQHAEAARSSARWMHEDGCTRQAIEEYLKSEIDDIFDEKTAAKILSEFEFVESATSAPMPDMHRLVIHDVGVWLGQPQPEIEQVLPEVFDKGAKMLINGNSKARKTFIMLQMAISIASGRPFLRWTPCRPMKCFVLQGEVPDVHFHARLLRACKCMDVNPESLKGMLKVVNTRGHKFTLDEPPQWLIKEASETDVLFVDPVYKFFEGEENSGSDAAKFLAGLDKLTVQSGASIVYVHHAAKGTAGDKQTIDRGSGSGVFARDFDCALFVSPHKEEPDTLVMEPIIRAYKPVEKFCIRFEDGVFRESDHLPVVQSSRDMNGSGVPQSVIKERIKDILSEGDFNKSQIEEEAKNRFSMARNAVRKAVENMLENGEIVQEPTGRYNQRLLHLNRQFAADENLEDLNA